MRNRARPGAATAAVGDREEHGLDPDDHPIADSLIATDRILQLRLVVEAPDFDDAVRFYRDTLGLTEQAAFEGDGDARVMILSAGRATLELANPAQKRMIDRSEVGREGSPSIRVAFEVLDAATTTVALVGAGAELIAAPTETPWRSLNSRLSAPAGLQITVFQELEPLDQRVQRPGFRAPIFDGEEGPR